MVYFYDSVKSLYSIGQCNYRFQLSTTNNNTFGWPAEKYKREKTWQTMEQEYNSHLSNNVMPLIQSLGWLAEQWVSCSSCLQHLLQIFKNKIHQKGDIDKEIPNWKKWSHKQNHPNRGVRGWIILDEMSVQADLQFYSRENKTYLIGFNDMDSESPFVENIKTKKSEVQLAMNSSASVVSDFLFPYHTSIYFRFVHFNLGKKYTCYSSLVFHQNRWCPDKQGLWEDSLRRL